jgi:NADH-quinone oxidoreductase subunit G
MSVRLPPCQGENLLTDERSSRLMRVITVCVGSACHLKGSHEIINFFKDAIRDANLEAKVELKGTFCMDKCTDGANLMVDDELFHANTVEDAQKIFETEILQKQT